jgi:hypothetical protein
VPIRDPYHGGGFSDVYKGRYQGKDVAVKRLRFNSDSNREQIHKVRGYLK